MRKPSCLSVLLAACLALASVHAAASGSVGPGGVKAAARADYARGKAIVFRELACSDCPLNKRDLQRERARELLANMDTADGTLRQLCAGEDTASCSEKLRFVRRYLERRYRIE